MNRSIKRALVVSVIGLFVIAVVGCAAGGGGRGGEKSNSGGIPASPSGLGHESVDLKLRTPERWVLKNGLTVLYLFDDELPLMSGAFYVRGGSLFDPKGKEGLASITGALIREGAPQGIAPDAFDSTLDGLGAAIESSFDDEFGAVKFSCLEENFAQVFSLYARTIKSPGFDEKRLTLSKQLALEGIGRRKDSPEAVAGQILRTGMFGEASPYGGTSSPQSVKAIGRSDLLDYWRWLVRPDYARLVITGSAPKELVRKLVDEQFGSWQQSATSHPIVKSINDYPVAGAPPRPAIYVWERDLQQVNIAVGHFGPPRLTADQFAISLFNRWFGVGGFESLLFSEIRSRLGLAYSVYGGFFPMSKAGTFEITLGTRHSEALRALQEILALLERTKTNLPETEALAAAKAGAAKGFVFRFSTPSAVLQRQASLELLGFPEDFDRNYIRNISAVKPDDVPQVAIQHLQPSKLVIAIVGKVTAEEVAKNFGKQFDVYRVSFDYQPKIGEKISAGQLSGNK